MRYVITVDELRTEWGLTSRENYDHSTNPMLKKDTEGRDLILVKEFEAETWEEAKKIYEEIRDSSQEEAS